MARVCPITGTNVVYLTCQECDDKVCRNPASSATVLPVFNLEHCMPELTALYLTQNCFARLHGEVTGAHILHSQDGRWYPEFPDKPTAQQKAILDEATIIVNTVIEKYDLKALGLKKEREKFAKAKHGMYKFAFYDKWFYVVIFDRKEVEEWYKANIQEILQDTEQLLEKSVISFPADEWEETETEGCYHVSIHIGEYVYFGNIRLDDSKSINAQVAEQLVCRCMDAYVADFLKENGVYE